MDSNTLIAMQQLEIATMKEKLQRWRDNARSIHMIIYGIGGPLNDNVRGYTRDQMVPFAQIAQHIEE